MKDRPSCKELRRINNNVYQTKLPSHLKTTDIVNMRQLIHYNGDSSENEEINSRTSSSELGDDDAAKLALEFFEKHDSTKLSRKLD